ncbi:peptide MFS transporter [Yinghuangia seranimata]|uniref:peptide MFS transporter n=1 Tax=Yinghuangia seranimata TaxID=408067 RepID=UPI00248AC1A3|nr:oligopeptide:H+ symporter [Yinghuangia seranimata]MDI2129548.1 oligopeptide:H+ symporter [Yinghuangia seranimata]
MTGTVPAPAVRPQTSATSPAPGSAKTFLGHPRALATLFMTEMWERFSFYGMRALLVLYLVAPTSQGGLGFDMATATSIYSIYNAMVYLLALPGGWLGDRMWGARRAVGIGGAVMLLGHLLLVLPGTAAFFVGLAGIAVGSGTLKANVSTMVGHLYDGPQDPRRDGGFTIFYMGINLGAFAAPLLVGWIAQHAGWRMGFAVAAAGIALGLVQYVAGRRHLAPASSRVHAPLTPAERRTVLRRGLMWLGVAVLFYGIVAASGSLSAGWFTWPLTVLGLVVPALYLGRIRRDPDLTPAERSKMTAYIAIFAAAAVFWMIYDQTGSTLNLFATDHTDNTVFGWSFPATWFQSLNPVYIMALAPLVAVLWRRLGRREPGTMTKFAYGLVGVGASFVVMMLAQAAAADARVTPLWLAAVYLIQTVAELCLSPVGISVTTKLAPAKYGSQMVGLWFLSVTAGDCVAALTQQIAGSATGSSTYFAMQGAMAIGAGVAVWVFRKRIQAGMGQVR